MAHSDDALHESASRDYAANLYAEADSRVRPLVEILCEKVPFVDTDRIQAATEAIYGEVVEALESGAVSPAAVDDFILEAYERHLGGRGSTEVPIQRSSEEDAERILATLKGG